MAKRKIGLTELAKDVDITLANLSILKNNKAKAVRLSTLDAICKALQCQPGDILEYVETEELEAQKGEGAVAYGGPVDVGAGRGASHDCGSPAGPAGFGPCTARP